MPRRARCVPENGLLHVFARGNNKRKIFLHLRHYRIFYAILFKVKTEENVKIHHYVFMPNHFHLIAGVNKNSDLGKFMMRLTLKYSNYFKKKYSFVGQLWQGRFKSRLIDTERYLVQCGKYIELNPVRAGIVDKPEDYIFSSYNHYAAGRKDKLIDVNPLYSDFSRVEEERQKSYKKLLINEDVTNQLKCSDNSLDDKDEKILKVSQPEEM
jgi:putative transposase